GVGLGDAAAPAAARFLGLARGSRHTRSKRDWSADVCSSDLDEAAKGESDMHKDHTTQAKQKKDEREEVLKEIRQLENRQKILEKIGRASCRERGSIAGPADAGI